MSETTTPDRARLLHALRTAVQLMRLIESGDRLLGRGVTPEHARAHAAACEVLDRCEAAGIAHAELLVILNEGATRPDPGFEGYCPHCGTGDSARPSRGRRRVGAV